MPLPLVRPLECGRFSLLEVECLGACVNAPILQVNDDFYEDPTMPPPLPCLTRLKRTSRFLSAR